MSCSRSRLRPTRPASRPSRSAHDGDNRSFAEIGVPEGITTFRTTRATEERIAKIERIDRWYSEQFAQASCTLLENARDVDGNSVLHNTRIVYGSGNADGNRALPRQSSR